jgi:hypothetical protein
MKGVPMVKVNVIMNTSMGEVLAFKCCALPDQNLEVQIENKQDRPIEIRNFFVLKNDEESLRIEHVYPPWHQRIAPNDICAFYCNMDEAVWKRFNRLSVMDAEGNEFEQFYPPEE